ncbi:MAG: tRNA dimethylallyltransferase [Halieaceae bacterium]|jgi:tRNA dimethylallyltransferase
MSASPILCLMGPTASGKTALAEALAESLNAELVSVDSALVYRGLTIGSAKPEYPHHLMDICDPAEVYSAARFAEDARRVIAELSSRGRRALLVGGTMLYYRALFEGLAPMPAADAALRRTLQARGERLGWPALHRELAAVDPESAARIHPNHSQRLVRALEVFELSGRPLSSLHREGRAAATALPCQAFAIAPRDRSVLHERIERRFRQMMADGFLDEVRSLHARPDLHPGLPAVRAVGYRQLWAHLDGELDLDEAVLRGIAATRQLAKRQFTWLRKWPDLQWIHTDADGRVGAQDDALSGVLQRQAGREPAELLLELLS